ncbi:Cof subfamily protein (haloacid dehalogenase superfamily) [Paenibacillus forsythiae]|uniref:Cof subfamily protein (Haloacid dehalogenase superfamily) n=1 Tax=Paenibacillus forsythiae TaxID=365616 RepID=A0ABU3HC81_9BACL|nr:Cof-type HAD-IIB family hydrolase [Paenibacillus forsythiae]MDT3428419.1 Cof subfamily protein (haloacid dehalogenase superfamily) [Paenibacillus forsythiae]
MIKAIFSDIDGTLLNSRHQITPETKSAIQEVKERDIPFVLVSARMPSGILPLQQELEINAPVICYSGALVLGGSDAGGHRETLHSVGIGKSSVGALRSVISAGFPGISLSLYSHDQWIVADRTNPWIIQEQEIIKVDPIERELSSYIEEDHEIHKILCMGNPQEINRLAQTLKSAVPGVSIYKSKDTYLEIMDEMVSKSYAIRELEAALHLSNRELMAIGDNYNDIDMILYAGLGIAMGNAPEEVKRVADQVTSSNDEDGLKAGIERFVLIRP